MFGRGLVLLALAAGLFAGAAAPASAAASPGPAHTVAAKPGSVAPTAAGVGRPEVTSPRVKPGSVGTGPVYSWTLALTAGTQSLWATQSTTLTATITGNTGPALDYVSIWDYGTNTLVGTCTGTAACSFPVQKMTQNADTFYAYVTGAGSSQKIAQTAPLAVTWNTISVVLSATQHTLPVGASTTLSTTESSSLLQTPFYVQIWDTTSNTQVKQCGGDPCSVTVTQNTAAMHTYVATVGLMSSVNPPVGYQASSPPNYVVWTNSGITVSLNVPDVFYQWETVTATANVNLSATSSVVEIFDINTGARIGVCLTASCPIMYLPPQYVETDLVAFVADDSTAFPPTGILAASSTDATTTWPIN